MARRERETSEYLSFARRIIAKAGERVADADDWELAELASLRLDVERAIERGVRGQRENFGRSWQYIGDALGMKRQSAQEKYGEKAAAS